MFKFKFDQNYTKNEEFNFFEGLEGGEKGTSISKFESKMKMVNMKMFFLCCNIASIHTQTVNNSLHSEVTNHG